MDVSKSVLASKLPENKNLKAVLVTAVVVLVIGAGAYFYFTNISGQPDAQEALPEFIIESSTPPLSDSKVIASLPKPEFVLTDGEVRIIPSDPSNLITSRVLMLGRIEENPVANSVTGEIAVLTSFRREDGESVLANLVFGLPNRRIGTLITTGGLIGIEQEWRVILASELEQLLKKNDPIFIYLEVDDVSREFFDNEKCVDICQDILQEIKDNFENNSRLVSAVRGEIDIPGDTLTVGSVSQVVIYGE